MVDDRVVTPDRGPARFAVRTQRPDPQAASETRIGAAIAERDDLVEQRGRPQMWVVDQPDLGVLGELLERVGGRTGPDARDSRAVQIVPDGLAVTFQMAGDRTDRPTLVTKCCCLHVVLPCEHCGGLLRALDDLAITSVEGAR